MKNPGIRSRNILLVIVRKFMNAVLRNNINKLKRVGKATMIKSDCYFGSPEAISIGTNVSINNECWIIGSGGIEIGNDVLIAPRVAFFSSNHNYKDKNRTVREQGYIFKKIIVEDDVWVGYNATILAGVTLGKGCIVAAGAVVTKNVDPYTVVGGIPAKRISNRT